MGRRIRLMRIGLSRGWSVNLFFGALGLVCLSITRKRPYPPKSYDFHLFPSEGLWGVEQSWHDGPMFLIGCGPFLAVSVAFPGPFAYRLLSRASTWEEE